jgi:group I intron endonuclease
MEFYVYITTNLKNGHQYIGDRTCFDSKNDNYLGSGNLLKKKIKEYGKDNFKKEILEFFPSKKEAYNAQENYIKLYKTHVSQGGYNISKKGGYSSVEILKESSKANLRKPKSEETKKLMSAAKLGKPHPHKGHKISEQAKSLMSKSLMGRSSSRLGKHHSEESKKLMRESKIGNTYRIGKYHSSESKYQIGKSNSVALQGNQNAKKPR